jgi:MFS family permease
VALSSFRPLRSRNFALVWSAALVSNVGSWMQTVALGFVITARTHNPLWTGLVAAAAFVPMGLLAPLGGALADRLDRRRWLIVTTVAEACFAAVLAVLAAVGHAPPLVLVGVAFLGGTAAAVGFPTYQAMLPDLVPRDDLLAAVSLSSAQFNLGRVIGPALAGIVLVVGSDAWAFAVNAASFGAVVIALIFVRLPAPKAPTLPVERIVRRIVAGARVAAGEPGCRSAIVLIAVVALIGSPFIGLVPAVAIDGLHRGAAATSALVTGQGIGAVVGALALAPLARAWGRRRLLVAALFAFPTAIVLYGAAPSLVTATLAIVVVGACYISVLTGLNTVVQLRAPEQARGRVLGLYMMALGTIYPIGLVIQGAIAGALGIRLVTVASGTLLVVVMAVLVLLRPGLFRALDDDHRATSVAGAASSTLTLGVIDDPSPADTVVSPPAVVP